MDILRGSFLGDFMRKILFILFSWSLFSQAVSILHLSFHKGCINDFQEVSRELGLELTTWNPLFSYQSLHRFLANQTESPMAVYNMTHERADRIYQANKAYFESFDLIITSDTVPLSRIFLQNGWCKPLIIWVCNRFNYCVGPGSEKGLDREYHDLFQGAMKRPNVKIVSYTPFEQYFAALWGMDIRGLLIKPIGTQEGVCGQSAIPAHVPKSETMFIYPGFPGCKKEELAYIQKQCSSLGFATYSGKYNGPDDLKYFKGVIYFPYQASNIALFENIQRGIIHFVPSERFIRELIKEGAPVYYWYEPYYCEWYLGEHRDIFIYFDSWDDLRNKVVTTDYSEMKKRVQSFAQYHRREMLERWRQMMKELGVSSPSFGDTEARVFCKIH